MQDLNMIYRIIYMLRRESVFEKMKELKILETSSPVEVKKYKDTKMHELQQYASENILYYKNRISMSMRISEMPIVDKGILRNNISELLNKKQIMSWRSTSGTTGAPFVFPKDRNATGYMDAMMHNAYSWHGINPGDRQARLWGRAIKPKQRMLQCVKDIILNRSRLSAFQNTEENFIKYYNKLLALKPKYFYSYSNALYQFSMFIERHGIDGNALNIKVAICTGEVLFPYQRKKIEGVIGCKVINEYGSTENGIIGFECEYGSMHVMPTVHAEILDPDESGLGEIIITELNSRSIPFIRYKIGDTGRIIDCQNCRCGRPFDLIEVHEGRIDDYIRCSDGKLVYDAILAYTLKDFATQFKAYQDEIDSIRIDLIPNNNYDEHSENKIKNLLHEYLGQSFHIEINCVNQIPSEQSGKYRYFVSRLNDRV